MQTETVVHLQTMCSSFLPYTPQAQSNSVLSGKAEVSLRNGHHAESWKSTKQQSLNERSEKIKVHFPVNKINENNLKHKAPVAANS